MRLPLCSVLALTAWLSAPAFGADAARQLAVDSLAFVGRMDAMLDGAIRSGSRADFDRFVAKPTVAQMQLWPAMGDAAHDRYRRCYFTVDAFRNYAEDSFRSGARIDAVALTAKDYAEQKALCRKTVK